ncbi:OprD family porin [Pseudomonas alkylphenolica]|uniref:OprD family porin n=1 Tax=Pseudomonas alkylphenolica TaxID=237609 RepID=UPI0018D98FED|nr:OprD family porin [Pseudomonas alkylphenolica]MBH3430165.1 OprD family porin [Pseudomonas alkylphenolica]
MWFKFFTLGMAGASVCLSSAVVSAAEANNGFIEDSTTTVGFRNFYWNADNRNGSYTNFDGERQSYRQEWAQGVLAKFNSGFTQGLVGFGLDLHYMGAVKLDGGKGRVGDGIGNGGIVARDNNGDPKSEFSKAGGAVKMRIASTELAYGDLFPDTPVLKYGDIRLLPQTLRGWNVTDRTFAGLTLNAGRFVSSSDRAQPNHGGHLGTAYGGRQADSDFVSVYGGVYTGINNVKVKLFGSELDDIWNQQFASIEYRVPLAVGGTFNTGINYYRTRDTGAALLGAIRNDAWSTRAGYALGGHKVELAFTQIDGDQPFDYVWNSFDIELDAASQGSDFNSPNEKAWSARYDLDAVVFGVPGLTFTARYIRGTDIDGRNASGAYSRFQAVHDGSQWERDLWVKYVVQSGPAKNLSLRLLHASMRTGGDYGAIANDLDQTRIILDYPLDLNFLK